MHVKQRWYQPKKKKKKKNLIIKKVPPNTEMPSGNSRIKNESSNKKEASSIDT